MWKSAYVGVYQLSIIGFYCLRISTPDTYCDRRWSAAQSWDNASNAVYISSRYFMSITRKAELRDIFGFGLSSLQILFRTRNCGYILEIQGFVAIVWEWVFEYKLSKNTSCNYSSCLKINCPDQCNRVLVQSLQILWKRSI